MLEFNNEIIINDRKISNNTPVYIIAEAGVNHNCDMDIARKMIDVAVEAGVDAVKFQCFKAENLILKNVTKAPYQTKTTDASESQYDMLKRLEVTREQNEMLIKYCKDSGITFLSTPFDEESLEELDELGVNAFKVAATDITNIQFLRKVALKGKPMVVSAGMCYLEEVQVALQAINKINKDVVLLQCTANYPIMDSEANIGVIDIFKDMFDMLVGYSDHSQGVGASPYAVARGAKVIEKHFTLDKSMIGPDHKASVNPEELKQLVKDIRRVEQYIGSGLKLPTASEQNTRRSLQKCFVAAKPISVGEVYTEDNLVCKRTNGVGISALYYDNLLGQLADKDYFVNDIIGV